MRDFGGYTAIAALLLSFLPGLATADASRAIRVLDKGSKPVPEAVVYLAGDGASAPVGGEPVIVDQIDKVFVPEITVIQAGTEVEFPNSDMVSHHVYSFAQPNEFELPLYKGGTRPAVRFDHPGVVVLGCNIHDSMVGYIVVVDTPNYSITDENGYADLQGLSAAHGQTIQIWSPRLDISRPLNATELPATSGGERVFRLEKKLRGEPKPYNGALSWDAY